MNINNDKQAFLRSGYGSSRSTIGQLLNAYSPAQGWDSFFLILGTVVITGFTVIEAEWVPVPGIMLLIVLSCFTGLILSKLNIHWTIQHILGSSLGIVLVLLQVFRILEGLTIFDKVQNMFSRLGIWYEAATTGGISTDLFPFSISLLCMAWLLGYLSTWFFFRLSNVWVGLVLTGTAILTNLSFLPQDYSTRFLVFILLSMILVAKTDFIQRADRWRKTRFEHSANGRWILLQVSLVLSGAILLISWIIPVQIPVWRTAVDVWNIARSPISTIEDEFSRLFSPIASRKDVSGRYFGDTLPFKGEISLGGDVVMQATSDYPVYWLNRTYSEYTPQGWIAGSRSNIPVGPKGLPPPPHESFRRDEIDQAIVVQFDTNNLWVGGNVEWISRGAIAEKLAPKSFAINISDLTQDQGFPDDVGYVARELRTMLNPLTLTFVESEIAQILPEDLTLISVSPGIEVTDRSRIDLVTIARKEPAIPDIVGWRSQKRLRKGEAYLMKSYVSRATVETLREAPTNYSGYLTDHYLQLPDKLPRRVYELGNSITEGFENPMDKALAIQDYLRSDQFKYTQQIDRPPRRADGVDYFLFESKAGYSDYYASAMAVLLRTVGIPARLAAGYSSGTDQREFNYRNVKDSDSHGWTQVYFPGHGWIDFEPTPAWPIQARGLNINEDLAMDSTGSQDEPFEGADNPIEEDLCLGELDVDDAFMQEDEDCVGEVDRDRSFEPSVVELTSTTVFFWILIIGILGFILAIALWLLWWIWITSSKSPESMYFSMNRLGKFAGINRLAYETPIQYGKKLGERIPNISSGAISISMCFSTWRYGKNKNQISEHQDLNEVWTSVRATLIRHALKRIVRISNIT